MGRVEILPAVLQCVFSCLERGKGEKAPAKQQKRVVAKEEMIERWKARRIKCWRNVFFGFNSPSAVSVPGKAAGNCYRQIECLPVSVSGSFPDSMNHARERSGRERGNDQFSRALTLSLILSGSLGFNSRSQSGLETHKVLSPFGGKGNVSSRGSPRKAGQRPSPIKHSPWGTPCPHPAESTRYFTAFCQE